MKQPSALFSGAQSVLCSSRTWAVGPIAVCIYLAAFASPLPWDIPLVALAVLTGWAVVVDRRTVARSSSPLLLPLLLFLLATGLSTMFSADAMRSLFMSAPFLPAVLLYFLVAEHFNGVRDIRVLYVILSIIALGLGCVLLWGIWQHGGGPLNAATQRLGIPMLKEDSDATFLAVLAPMSLAVLWSAPGRALRVVLCLSLLASVCAVCLIVSRTAAITMVICVVGFVALMLGRRGVLLIFACAILTVLAMLSVDAAQGFQMVTKSVEDWHSGSLNGRNIPWRVGWAMFLDAPMLGHGPHTFAPLYDKYMHALGLPIPHHTHRSAHNLYVEVLAAQGLVGFASFVYLLVRGASLAWRMPRSARAGLWPVTAGALAATIGFIAAGLVELTLLRGWVVIIMLTLLGTIAHLWSCATEGRTAE